MRERRGGGWRSLRVVAWLVCGAGAAAWGMAEDAPAKKPAAEPATSEPVVTAVAEPVREIHSGQVVLLNDALKRRGIKSYPEENKGQVVLETPRGELWPILPDGRGRALYQDERLRNRPVDLIVLRRDGLPYLQVLSIYTFDEKKVRQLTDYWCDICSIPMYEIKDCECCQGPTRLRFQPKDLPAQLPITPGSSPTPKKPAGRD